MKQKDRITVYVTRPQRAFLEEKRKDTGINLSAQILGILSAHMKQETRANATK